MSDWKASGGRISLLPAAPVPSGLPSALELYRHIWGAEPESFQKPSNPLMPSIAQGSKESLNLSCTVQPNRVDFAISPLTPFQDPTGAQFPVILDAGQLVNELLRCIGLIGRNLVPNSIFRAALALQFMNVRPSFVDANKILTAVIPASYGVRLTDEEDFVFQVNRQYPSRSENIRMNALTKWSVDRLRIVTFSVSTQNIPAASPSLATQPLTSEFISASVTFDNNNAPTDRALSPQIQAAVLNEALASVMRTLKDIGLQVEGFENADLPR